MALFLVTGASGFIGTHVVRRLLAEGRRVRVLARDPARLAAGVADRVEVTVGDLRRPESLRQAVAGVDTVLHLAALARMRAQEADFAAVNAAAVSELLAAARAAAVRRVVHVSTWLVGPPDRPAPLRGSALRPTPYEASKQAAERAVLAWVESGGDAVIVRPTRVYGPGPLDEANGATWLLDLYLRGRLPARLADGGALANWVHVDDVAAGTLGAAARGRRGAAYVLGGPDDASVRDYLALAAETAGGRRRLPPAVPAAVALAYARVGGLLGGLAGLPAITPNWLRTFLESRTADIGPARHDLGYAPRPLRQGVAETVAWLERGDRSW